jgi:hypothetical protein
VNDRIPIRVRPMLALLVPTPFHRPGWVFEEKYDGIRILAYKEGANVKLLSRAVPYCIEVPYFASGGDGGDELAFEQANQRLGPRLAGSPANCALCNGAAAALTLKSYFRDAACRKKADRLRLGVNPRT